MAIRGAVRAARLAVTAALLVTGCSGGMDAAGSRAGDGAGGDAGRVAEAADAGDGVTESAAAAGDVLDAGSSRRRARSARLSVEVERLRPALAAADAAVEGLGGFVADESVELHEVRTATVTYRVPDERFRDALRAVGDLGRLRSQQVSTEDVTSRYADLESRVGTLRASITRLQSFLGDAGDVAALASLEGELTRREGELASLEGQRRALADRTDLSTIGVTFDAPRSEEVVDDGEDRPTFAGGLDRGVDLAAAIGTGLLAVAGFLLPFAAVVVPVALVAVLLRRHRRVPRAATAAAAAGGPPGSEQAEGR